MVKKASEMNPDNNIVVVSLRPMDTQHVRQTFEWVMNEELRSMFLMRELPSWREHQNYFRKQFRDLSVRWYAIYYDETHVGNCGLKNISTDKEDAELWIYIGEQRYRGRGVGKDATGKLLAIAFEELELQRVYLHVADFNARAIRMYEALGFVMLGDDSMNPAWCDNDCQVLLMELTKERL